MQLAPFTDHLLPTLAITTKTRKNYESSFNVNIRPHLGEKELSDITKNDLIKYLPCYPHKPATQR
jgi:hypothetical protein